jgi:hypothetical protein
MPLIKLMEIHILVGMAMETGLKKLITVIIYKQEMELGIIVALS